MSTKPEPEAARPALLPVLCALAVILPGAAAAQQHAGQYEVADVEYGAQIFAERCVACHGERGDLMPQANLRSGRFRNASSDRELAGVIRDGVPGTAMVATGYTNAELTALVAYLRNITIFDPSGVAIGDPARGRTLFFGAGECASCHRVGTEGTGTAPPLTRIGAMRTAALLERTLLEPDAALLPINRPVRAVTADGAVVNGRRLNEDTFQVLLYTADGRLAALDKRTLSEYAIGTESAMPSYRDRFDEQQIADLVAYLLSLKGLDR